MTDKKWNTAALRIGSKTMSAAEVTNTLRVKPTSSYEKGTPFSRRKPKSAVMQQSLWILESGLDSSESIATHIAKLISLVEEKVALFKQLIPVCNIDI